MEVAHVRSRRSAFHTLGAATANFLSPKVLRLLFSITRGCLSPERSVQVREYGGKSEATDV